MPSKIISFIQPRHLGLVGLVLLAGAFISLFRYDSYGIEEGAAQALLINWTIIHQIISPVALYGLPDLRAILFVPLDMYWAGSLAAAKVYTMFILFGTALMLYRWGESTYSPESSMIATALLLLAPISFMQTDALGGGIYILFAFVVTGWLGKLMEQSDHPLPSWYFLILLTTALAVSIHPMGLAIPVVLILRWWLQHKCAKQERSLVIGVSITTILLVLLRWGWNSMESAAANPLHPLTDILFGSPILHTPGWATGMIIVDLLVIAIGFQLFRKTTDTLSQILIVASLIGALHADHAWAMIAWACTLYLGMPLLIELNERWGWRGLVGQRGVVLVICMIVATISMVHDRQAKLIAKQQLMDDTDRLISTLAREASDTSTYFLAASQWPARTLLACHRDVLPLPPATEDIEHFQSQVSQLSHMVFDPKAANQHQLARNAAALSHELETIALMPGGVILRSKQNHNKPANN